MQNFAMASSMMMPMTNVFGSITDGLNNASGLIGDLDFVSSNVTSLFGNGFSKILGQLGNIGSAIQYLIIKIQTVLQRLIATVAVIMFSMSSVSKFNISYSAIIKKMKFFIRIRYLVYILLKKLHSFPLSKKFLQKGKK